MDIIREDFLLEMIKTGRAYPHEVKSIADELLRLRGSLRNEPNDETSFNIRINRAILLRPAHSAMTDARLLSPGGAMLIAKDGKQYITYRLS